MQFQKLLAYLRELLLASNIRSCGKLATAAGNGLCRCHNLIIRVDVQMCQLTKEDRGEKHHSEYETQHDERWTSKRQQLETGKGGCIP